MLGRLAAVVLGVSCATPQVAAKTIPKSTANVPSRQCTRNHLAFRAGSTFGFTEPATQEPIANGAKIDALVIRTGFAPSRAPVQHTPLRLDERNLRGQLEVEDERNPLVQLEKHRYLLARQNFLEDRNVFQPQLHERFIHSDRARDEALRLRVR